VTSRECPRLYYETHGERGPHVLLVHGMISARSHWLPNLAALCEYARPVVVELYGHGRSPTPEDPACYHPDHYVAEFERIRGELEVERWFLVGQSLGAGLILRYSLAHPDRVVAQAFTNSASAFAPPAAQERMRANREAQQQRLARGEAPDPRESPLNPARNRRVTPEVRAALEADVARHDRIGVARTSMYTAAHVSLHGRIGEISVPTLLVVGEREERFEPDRRFIESHLPGLEVAALNGGHGVNLDAPADFDAALRSFFIRHTERVVS
jgi:2-succinyl-6-hydroxy-2,4-cyclohexadiene-1-carboxylate synthase